MSNLITLATSVLSMGKRLLPQLRGAPEAVETARSLGSLIQSVRGFADPPTRAELDALEAEVMAGLDDTINRLGDDPAPRR